VPAKRFGDRVEIWMGWRPMRAMGRDGARIVCDGDEVTLAPGELLFVAPDVFREGVALETSTTVLVVGRRAGAAYEPPPFALDRAE
jgi:hypothetical protein